MDYQKLAEKFSDRKILVVGDIILDHYIYGNSRRISPEAPVPVINFGDEFYGCGGAANVAVNLMNLGAEVKLCGRIGKDDWGRKIKELLRKEEFLVKDLIVAKDYSNPVKTRLISDGQQIVRLDREIITPLSSLNENKAFSAISENINNFRPHAIIISDYAKGFLSVLLTSNIIKLARKHKIKVIVDPKGLDYSKYKGADFITPNTTEAEQVCGFKVDSDENIEKALRYISRISGIKNVLITRGSRGTSFLNYKKKIDTLRTEIREVYDVTGAGDTFSAVFTLGVISGFSVKESVDIANTAAGIVIQRMGTSSVTQHELISRLYDKSDFKLLTRSSAGIIVNTYRTSGKKIVFTNGCFDLFHSGHLDLLKQSKELGDILIVAINSDNSVRKLKGQERPIINENERVSIISALNCVDHVIIFEEDTPLELIEIIKPEILTKGSDYRKQDVIGRNVLSGYGGVVKIIPISKDVSTSTLVRRIKNTY